MRSIEAKAGHGKLSPTSQYVASWFGDVEYMVEDFGYVRSGRS